MVTRKKLYIKPTKIKFTGRSYKNYIKEDFQEALLSANWEIFYRSQDPDFLWGLLREAITSNIDKMCPLKSYSVNEFREPWITNEAIEATKDKKRLLLRAKRSMKEEDWVAAKRMRNEVGKNLKNLRVDFFLKKKWYFQVSFFKMITGFALSTFSASPIWRMQDNF